MWKSFRLHRSIVSKFPDNDKVQYNTGLCYKRFKRYKKSIKFFSKAIELKPENLDYKLTRGRVYMRLKQHDLAQNDLIEASKSNEISKKLLAINTHVLNGEIDSYMANIQAVKLATGK